MGSKHAEGPNGKPWWYVNDVSPLATVPSLYDEGDALWAISGTFEIDPPTDHLLRNYSSGRDGLAQPAGRCSHSAAACSTCHIVVMIRVIAKHTGRNTTY